eukprot:GHVT01045373.1.p1 GENE.GHVT01045373.1~~GHVT01045373.1.p1  ORF type:complete len:268 (+),score=19.67 GHVT01045373.1:356-1159(+)
MPSTMRRCTSTVPIQFFYDIGSFYSFLGFVQLRRYCETLWTDKLKVLWRPILLGGVFKATNGVANIAQPGRAAYFFEDALRYALALGLEVKFPPKIPPNTLKVMRVLTAIHLRQPNALEEATKAFFEAAWLRGLDVEDDEVLIQTLVSHGIASGHDAREFVHATSAPEVKISLKANTEDAVKLGIFGAPTIAVDRKYFPLQKKQRLWGADSLGNIEGSTTELFWGSDRFPLLAEMLELPWHGYIGGSGGAQSNHKFPPGDKGGQSCL